MDLTGILGPQAAAWLHWYVDACREPLLMIAAMWALQILASLGAGGLVEALSVRAWKPLRLYGVVTSHFAHGGWGHLIANTVPFVVLGSLVKLLGTPAVPATVAAIPVLGRLLTSFSGFWLVTVCAGLASGLGAFFANRVGVATLGASGLIFGYFGYVMAYGLRLGAGVPMTVALIVGAAWGLTMLRGIIPRLGSDISWQGHLFGLAGGVGLAVALTPAAG